MSSTGFFWFVVSFLSGSVPYSLIVGHLAGAGDIRTHGDGNPGATNVGRVLGRRWFMVAMLLDSFKGAIPIWLVYFGGQVSGWELAAVSAAPVLGHAFSPWLRLRGGKAVAVTFGVWAGLTLAIGPSVLGLLLLLAYKTVRVSGWAVLLAFSGFGLFLCIVYAPAHPEFIIAWLANALILSVKHAADLRQPPGLRPEIFKRRGRS